MSLFKLGVPEPTASAAGDVTVRPSVMESEIDQLYTRLLLEGRCETCCDDAEATIRRRAATDGLEVSWWEDRYGSAYATLLGHNDSLSAARLRATVARLVRIRAAAYYTGQVRSRAPFARVKGSAQPHALLEGQSVDELFRAEVTRLAATDGHELEWAYAIDNDAFCCRVVPATPEDRLKRLRDHIAGQLEAHGEPELARAVHHFDDLESLLAVESLAAVTAEPLYPSDESNESITVRPHYARAVRHMLAQATSPTSVQEGRAG